MGLDRLIPTMRRLVASLLLVVLLSPSYSEACAPVEPAPIPNAGQLHQADMPFLLAGPRWVADGLEYLRWNDYGIAPGGIHGEGLRVLAQISGGWSGDLDGLDAELASGDLGAARARLARLEKDAEDLAFSARPEHTPVLFVQRRLAHRKVWLRLLAGANAPDRDLLRAYFRIRSSYETPVASWASEPSGDRAGVRAFRQDQAATERALADLDGLGSRLGASVPGADVVLSYDRGAFLFALGRYAEAGEAFHGVATGPDPDLSARAAFMEARCSEAGGDRAGALARLAKLAKGPMGAEALARRAFLFHLDRQFSREWNTYRELWGRFPDHPVLAEVDHSAFQLARMPGGPVGEHALLACAQRLPPPLQAAFDSQWAPPADGFNRWLYRRWRLRALYRAGDHAGVLEHVPELRRGRADGAFVGNLLVNLLWVDLRYDPDHHWNIPVFANLRRAQRGYVPRLNTLLGDFPGADWAARALFVDHGATLVTERLPFRCALRHGTEPYLLMHLMRTEQDSGWGKEQRAAMLFARADFVTLLREFPGSPLALLGALELVSNLEMARFPYRALHAAPLEVGVVAPAQISLRTRGEGAWRSVPFTREDVLDSLASMGVARSAAGDPWGFALQQIAAEAAGAGNGNGRDSPQPTLESIPAGHPAFAWALISRARADWAAGAIDLAPYLTLLDQVSADHGLRHVPVPVSEGDPDFTGSADAVGEFAALLCRRVGRGAEALQRYERLGYGADADLVLQEDFSEEQLRDLVRGRGEATVRLRLHATWILMRRQMARNDFGSARDTWQAGNAWHAANPAGGPAPQCGVQVPPDFIWRGEARCLGEYTPILTDLRELAQAGRRGKRDARAAGLYAFARYAYYQASVFLPGLGELDFDRDMPGYHWNTSFRHEERSLSLEVAERAFRRVIREYPRSPQSVDARYTLGLMAMGDRLKDKSEPPATYWLPICALDPDHPLADDAWAFANATQQWDADLRAHPRDWGRQPDRPLRPDEVAMQAQCEAHAGKWKEGDMALWGGLPGEVAHGQALHIPEALPDDRVDWIRHSLEDHNWGSLGAAEGRLVWRDGALFLALHEGGAQAGSPGLVRQFWVRRVYSAAAGRQEDTAWARISLPGLSVVPLLGYRIAAQAVNIPAFAQGDILEVWIGDSVAADQGPRSSVPVVLRFEARPRDLGAIHGP